MRVALCFSGLPRFLNQTYIYWHRSIVSKYQTDVFVHTWLDPFDQVKNSVVKQQVFGLFSPRMAQFEMPEIFDVSSYQERLWPHRITPQAQFSQFLGIKRAQQLRQKTETAFGFQYDIVVRARFDWYLEQIDFEQNPCVNVARTPTLDGHRFRYDQTPLVGISDQFAYGSSENMNIYSTIVDNIPNLYHNHQVDFCGELFLRAHLHENHMCIKQHELNNGIVRDWGIMP